MYILIAFVSGLTLAWLGYTILMFQERKRHRKEVGALTELANQAIERYERFRPTIGALDARIRKIDPEPQDELRCVSGHTVCKCGREYREHPVHPSLTFLTITCEGELVKL